MDSCISWKCLLLGFGDAGSFLVFLLPLWLLFLMFLWGVFLCHPLICWYFAGFISVYSYTFSLDHLIYPHDFIYCAVDFLIYIYSPRTLLWAPNLNTQVQPNKWNMVYRIGTSETNSVCHKRIFLIQICHSSSIHPSISILVTQSTITTMVQAWNLRIILDSVQPITKTY